jgi:hypothetical protein
MRSLFLCHGQTEDVCSRTCLLTTGCDDAVTLVRAA